MESELSPTHILTAGGSRKFGPKPFSKSDQPKHTPSSGVKCGTLLVNTATFWLANNAEHLGTYWFYLAVVMKTREIVVIALATRETFFGKFANPQKVFADGCYYSSWHLGLYQKMKIIRNRLSIMSAKKSHFWTPPSLLSKFVSFSHSPSFPVAYVRFIRLHLF